MRAKHFFLNLMNLYEYFIQNLEENPDSIAVKRLEKPDLTYRELNQQAKRVSAWLDEKGIEEGERIAVYMMDTPAYISIVLGIWRAGAIATPMNIMLGMEELEYILKDVRPTAMFYSPFLAENAEKLIEKVDSIDYSLLAESDGEFNTDKFPNPKGAPEIVVRFDSDTAIVMHTSGTTGEPKGVVQTHRNIGAQIDSGVNRFGLNSSDVSLTPVPLFHVGGLHGAVLMALFNGASVAIQPGWDAEKWAQYVEECEVTYTGLIPTMMVDVLNTEEVESYDTSSLRLVVVGGSPGSESLLEEFRERFDVKLSDYYGQTENSGVSIAHGSVYDMKPNTTGKPMPTVEAKIIDIETGEDLPPGEAGELLLRGDIITPQYWERPDKNSELFTDDWLHTEDVFKKDEEGFFSFVERRDDMILSGGEKIPPRKVEDVLQQMPEIEEVAVIGTPHERYGETVTAVIIRSDEDLSEEDVYEFCEDRDDFASYMKPRRVFFVEEFPLTGSLKVDKVSLTERIESKIKE